MNNKKFTPIVILLVTSFLLTGCTTKLVKLKPKEEEAFVSYASSVVAKYNKNQDKGGIKKAYQKKDNKKSKGKSNLNNKHKDITDINDALSVEGITFTAKPIEIESQYTNGDKSFVVPLKPKEGKSYLVCKILAKNDTDNDIFVDFLSKNYTYKFKLNGSDTQNNETTILLNDLSTYKGTIKAKEETELVLLFQFDTNKLDDIKDKLLEMKKENKIIKINL